MNSSNGSRRENLTGVRFVPTKRNVINSSLMKDVIIGEIGRAGQGTGSPVIGRTLRLRIDLTDGNAARSLSFRSVHRPGRCRVRELRDDIADAAPDRDTVVITGSGEFVGARDAFRLGLRAVALQHQVGGPPDVDFRYHAAKAMGSV